MEKKRKQEGKKRGEGGNEDGGKYLQGVSILFLRFGLLVLILVLLPICFLLFLPQPHRKKAHPTPQSHHFPKFTSTCV